MRTFHALPRVLLGFVLLSAAAAAFVPRGAWAQTLFASSETDNQIFAIETSTGAGRVVLDNTSGFLNSPEGLAYYAPTGDLFIANGGGVSSLGGATGSIVRFNTNTGATSVFFTASDPTVLNSPQGLAFDASGNLFVTGYNSGTIVEFAGDGSGNLNATPTVFATGLTKPYYLAFGPTGDLFVADPGAATPEIRRFLPGGTSTQFEINAVAAPIGVAFRGNTLFSSDTVSNTIAGFNNASGDPTTRTTTDLLFTPSGNAALNAPQALAYDSGRDVLYVANFDSNNIVRVNASSGAADVLFSGIAGPTGLALTTPEPPTGVLYLGGVAGASGFAFLRARRRRRRAPLK